MKTIKTKLYKIFDQQTGEQKFLTTKEFDELLKNKGINAKEVIISEREENENNN